MFEKCFPVFCSGRELEPSEGSLTSTSGSSLYSGSEFEEFLPTKGFNQSVFYSDDKVASFY